jgi:hypothetical protein
MLGLVVDVTRSAVPESMFDYSFASKNKVIASDQSICQQSI